MFGFNPLYAALYAAGLAGPVPAYSLDFMTGTVPAGITFSRGSQATMIGPTGLMEYAPHNLITRSEPLGGTAGSPGVAPTGWTSMTTTGAGLTRTLAFGTLTTGEAYVDVQLVGTATVAGTLVIDPVAANVVAARIGQPFAGSVLVALVQGSVPAGRQWSVQLIERSSTQTFLANSSVAVTPTATMTRYSVSRTMSIGTTAFVQLGVRMDGMQIGDVVNLTLRVAAPQLSEGTSAANYYPTTGSAYYGPRFEYNPQTLLLNGVLIEGGRTNLCPSSRYWDVDGVTLATTQAGADGAPNVARLVTEMTTTAQHRTSSNSATLVPFTLGTTYTISALVKPGTANRCQLHGATSVFPATAYANFSLVGAGSVLASSGVVSSGIKLHGNGYYLCWATITATATASAIPMLVSFINSDTATRGPAYLGTGLTLIVDHSQLEVGTFPTSIITSYGATVTRAADSLTTSSLSWLNASAGTAVSEYIRPIVVAAQHVFSLSNAGSFNDIIYQAGGSGSPGQRRFDVTVGAVNQVQLQMSATQTAGVVYKDAMRWAVNNFAASENGAAPIIDLGGTVPTVNLLSLGTGSDRLIYIRKFAYYNTALGDSQLVALSTV